MTQARFAARHPCTTPGLLRVLLAGLLLAALAGCAAPVKTEYDQAWDFAGYERFAWESPERDTVRRPIFDSEILDRRMELVTTGVLEERGFHSVTADEADFLVTYHLAVRTIGTAPRSSVGVGVGTARGGGRRTTTVGVGTGFTIGSGGRQREEATIIIDILDAESGNLIWRGWRSDEVRQDRYSPERLERLMRRILEEFPPGQD